MGLPTMAHCDGPRRRPCLLWLMPTCLAVEPYGGTAAGAWWGVWFRPASPISRL